MSFNLAAFNGVVTAVAFTVEGYLYVAGDFTTYDGDAVDSLIRLKPDGTLDEEFDSKLTSTGNYYPPTQLSVTPDGGVVAGLSTTKLVILKGGGVNDRMLVDSVEVPSIIRFYSNGQVAGTWQTGLAVGEVMKAFTVVGAQRVAYIVQSGAIDVAKLVRTDNLETYNAIASTHVFNDIVALDKGRLMIVGDPLVATVTQALPAAQTFAASQWPLAQGIMLVDFTMTPIPFWVSSAGAADKGCYEGVYSAEWARVYVGQRLTIDGVFGQWCGSTIEQHRGMIASGLDFVSGASSEWDLRSEVPEVTANKQGFETFQDTTDDDSFTVVARPLVVNKDTGSVFVTAPFGKLKDVARTKYGLYEISKTGVVTAFATPALSSGGIPRILCAAISPNMDVVVAGGRLTTGALALKATTGVATTIDVVDVVPHSLSLGGGVRGLTWMGFGENLYQGRAAK